MGAGGNGSSRLAEQSHILRVTTGRRDITLYPSERVLLVQKTEDTGILQARKTEEAEDIQPELNRDNDHAAFQDKASWVVAVGGPSREATAMQPDHHRPTRSLLRKGRRRDI